MPKTKSSSKLSKIPVKRRSQEPVWRGPQEDGITQSLLSRFLCCRERFRLLVIEGLKPEESFNARLEYGNLWHACEEAHALRPGDEDYWQRSLLQAAKQMAQRYHLQQDQVQHWYRVCRVQFPLYVEWWAKHPDMLVRTPLMQEEVFQVQYDLPSGRFVCLRGKFDSVDIIGKDAKKIWLQENKTKGDVNPDQMRRHLTFDLQTGFYMIALRGFDLAALNNPIVDGIVSKVGSRNMFGGVRYNVIRRPLSGGRHSIRQHKPSKSNPEGETTDQYYARLEDLFKNDSVEPDGSNYYFMRWNVEVLPSHVDAFQDQFLTPALEQLCDWWEWINGKGADGRHFDAGSGGIHWRFPFGVYNPTLEDKSSEIDEYLISGSEVGLHRVTELFPELK